MSRRADQLPHWLYIDILDKWVSNSRTNGAFLAKVIMAALACIPILIITFPVFLFMKLWDFVDWCKVKRELEKAGK